MKKCRLEIKVVPGASRSEVVGWLGETSHRKVVEIEGIDQHCINDVLRS